MGTHYGPRPLGNARVPAIASGGTETVIEQDGKFYRVHTFTEVGESTLDVQRGGEVECLLVGGGGGGAPGGGGGGGYFKEFAAQVSAGLQAVIVGAGGQGIQEGTSPTNFTADSGQPSSALGKESLGGGGGFTASGADVREGGDGGSGGGAGASTDMPVGDGGTNGGDGGAGQRGDGGSGQGTLTESAISGTLTRYSGGGGGAHGGDEAPQGKGGDGGGGDGRGGSARLSGQDGQANTGGGGGATGYRGFDGNGGSGGSGIVIVRYRITQAEYDAEVA